LVEGSSSSQRGTTNPPTRPIPAPPPTHTHTQPKPGSPSMPLRHPGQQQSKARRSEGVFAAAARLQSESPAWCCQRKNRAAGMAASSCRQLSRKIGKTKQQRSSKQRQHCVQNKWHCQDRHLCEDQLHTFRILHPRSKQATLPWQLSMKIGTRWWQRSS